MSESEHQEERRQPEPVEKRTLSEAVQVLQVAAPVVGAVAGAVTAHVLQNRPSKPTETPTPPPTIVLPPGVHHDE